MWLFVAPNTHAVSAVARVVPATLCAELYGGGGTLAVITPPTETRPALLYAPEWQWANINSVHLARAHTHFLGGPTTQDRIPSRVQYNTITVVATWKKK